MLEDSMPDFTELELAALRAIFAETPEVAPGLERQLESATVTKRENTGAGFFTTITVADDAPPVNCPNVLGHETHATVDGLDHGLGFVLFVKNGRMHLLEGYSVGPDDTDDLDLETVGFTITKTPIVRH